MADPDISFGIQLSSIRDRLSGLSYFNHVSDIQNGSQAIEGAFSFNPPAAFVSTARESFEPNRLAAGGHSQRGTSVISVLCAIPSERAADDLSDAVEQSKKAVLAQLKGWQPTGAEKALDAVSYTIRLIHDGIIWIEWLFSTTYLP